MPNVNGKRRKANPKIIFGVLAQPIDVAETACFGIGFTRHGHHFRLAGRGQACWAFVTNMEKPYPRG